MYYTCIRSIRSACTPGSMKKNFYETHSPQRDCCSECKPAQSVWAGESVETCTAYHLCQGNTTGKQAYIFYNGKPNYSLTHKVRYIQPSKDVTDVHVACTYDYTRAHPSMSGAWAAAMNMIDLRRLYGLHHVFICITIVYTCNTPGLFAGSAVIHSACLTKTPLSKVSAYSLVVASQFPYS